MEQSQRTRQQSTRTTRQKCSNSQWTRWSETVVGQEAERERKEDNEAWGRKWWSMWSLQNKKCDTAMDANWATSNCHTSMVQMVLYSRCTETTVRAYNTVVTHRQKEKSNHQIHHGEILNDKTTINKNNKTTLLNLTRNKRERDSGRAISWEGKEGREGSLRKEVIIVEFAKQTNVTLQWMQPG